MRKLVPASHKLAAPEFLELPGLHPLLQGKLNICAGPIAASKSTYACLAIARYTQLGGHVGVVITEDDWNDFYGLRLEAAGADLSRVHFRVMPSWRLPASADSLRKWAKDNRCGLVVIDLANDLARGDLREAYIPVMRHASLDGTTYLLLIHTNKHLTRGQEAVDAIPGRRGGLQGLVKNVLVIAKSADNPDSTRLVGVARNNYLPSLPSFEYAVKVAIDLPPSPWHDQTIDGDVVYLEYLGPSDLSATAILRQAQDIEDDDEENAPQRSAAAKALGDLLKDGKEHFVSEIKQIAAGLVISYSTFKRVKLEMGVEHAPRGKENVWFAPAGLLAELQRGANPDEADPDD
jgi:hypothetical protein